MRQSSHSKSKGVSNFATLKKGQNIPVFLKDGSPTRIFDDEGEELNHLYGEDEDDIGDRKLLIRDDEIPDLSQFKANLKTNVSFQPYRYDVYQEKDNPY